MSDIVRRLSTEGVDPLSLAGVNDGNLVELARRTGVRVSLRKSASLCECGSCVSSIVMSHCVRSPPNSVAALALSHCACMRCR